MHVIVNPPDISKKLFVLITNDVPTRRDTQSWSKITLLSRSREVKEMMFYPGKGT